VDDLRNFLFGPSAGMDLAAINIQRGRDLGLGTLNETRLALGLKAYTSFEAITSDAATATALKAAYGDVNKVELWIGGLAENHLPGAMVGQTFDLIISKQFEALRDGDRLWYQNQGFDAATLSEIESTTLSSLILKDTNTQHIQADAFVYYERRSGLNGGGVMQDSLAPQLVVGSDGGDTLIGGSRNDLLVAGAGRQFLTGGEGSDTFIFGKAGIRAEISDFKVGVDRLQFEGLGQPFGTSSLQITNENGHAALLFGGDKISLLGVSTSQFRPTDVSFL
jgi:Ca2+-binding RTX toxin-like protein